MRNARLCSGQNYVCRLTEAQQWQQIRCDQRGHRCTKRSVVPAILYLPDVPTWAFLCRIDAVAACWSNQCGGFLDWAIGLKGCASRPQPVCFLGRLLQRRPVVATGAGFQGEPQC